MVLLDSAPEDLLNAVIKKSLEEKGRRLPLHGIHRWWSRRFSALYRFILASFLNNDPDWILTCINQPWLMRERAKGKVFYEPFAGGGTGLIEAALAGWNVYGSEVNPVAADIVESGLQIVREGIPDRYFKDMIKVLELSLEALKELWYLNDGLISYTLVSRGRIPTWITTRRNNGREEKLLICPNCMNIFFYAQKGEKGFAKCPLCEEKFSITIKPAIDIPSNLPEVTRDWKAFIVELRIKEGSRWRKKWINLILNREVSNHLKKVIDKALKYSKDSYEFLSTYTLNGIFEGRRLKREGGLNSLADFFTPRQLTSFELFTKTCTKIIDKKYWRLARLALSETAKSSSIAAKWYPPTGEPIPAAAIKTYWISAYAVETNPLAHIPGRLIPLARNSLASSIRAQKRAVEFVRSNGDYSKFKYKFLNVTAENFILPQTINLAVIDPPYLGRVKSYTSLSLVHYSAFILFNYVSKEKMLPKIHAIESLEVTISNKRYREVLNSVMTKVAYRLKDDGRVVLMYNRQSIDEWKIPLEASKMAKLYPIVAYWVLGETPGRLARSTLRGLFLVIFSRKPHRRMIIIFKNILENIEKYGIFLDMKREYEACMSLIKALSSVYHNITIVER